MENETANDREFVRAAYRNINTIRALLTAADGQVDKVNGLRLSPAEILAAHEQAWREEDAATR